MPSGRFIIMKFTIPISFIHRSSAANRVISLLAIFPGILFSATDAPLRYIEPMLTTSFRIPTGVSSSTWKPYLTAGINFAVPATMKNFSCLFGVEGGTIEDHEAHHHLQCIHSRFSLQYRGLFEGHIFTLIPEAGLSTIMISYDRGDLLDIKGTHFFSNVENEYGIHAGFSPGVRYGRFSLMLPMHFERTFSSPDRFDQIIISALFMYRFAL